jgi:hypothetical protein
MSVTVPARAVGGGPWAKVRQPPRAGGWPGMQQPSAVAPVHQQTKRNGNSQQIDYDRVLIFLRFLRQ